MLRRALPLVVLLGACKKEEREIPMWQDGNLVTGDCGEEYVGVGASAASQLVLDSNPLIAVDAQANDLGTIVRDEQAYYDLMVGLNFSSWQIVDFTQRQVVAIWLDQPGSCGVTADGWAFHELEDGRTVFEATFTDSSLNCAEQCPGVENHALIMVSVDATIQEMGLCRVVVPGCEAR